ncbi:MAG: hypothetical protein IH849_14625, partial [Acidobacteria bacterium]|nr:hypothetical protein [Acidobacteriota bacterium]
MAPVVFSQALVVNEFLASNSNTNFDEDGDSSDWLELYNGSGDAIDLDGYGVPDEVEPDSNGALPWWYHLLLFILLLIILWL